MAKRTNTRMGDIFCVEIDGEYKRYFQYVARDSTQLGGQVIRFFAHHYSMDEEPTMYEIIDDKIDFFALTFINVGIWYEAWYKVGKHKDVGDAEHIYFRLGGEYWQINHEIVKVGRGIDEFLHYPLGKVYSYVSILEKLKTGKYPGETKYY